MINELGEVEVAEFADEEHCRFLSVLEKPLLYEYQS